MILVMNGGDIVPFQSTLSVRRATVAIETLGRGGTDFNPRSP